MENDLMISIFFCVGLIVISSLKSSLKLLSYHPQHDGFSEDKNSKGEANVFTVKLPLYKKKQEYLRNDCFPILH